MLPYAFDQRVLEVDLLRLRRFFPDRDSFTEMERRLKSAIDTVCRNPRAGKELDRDLAGWFKYSWESGPEPNWDPWPDMRLIYCARPGAIKVFAVGRRAPGRPDDVYSLVRERLKTPLNDDL